MNFNEAYNYLISFNNLPRKEYMNDPRHCGWYLKRLQFFLNMIGNPERKIPHYLHVTGTSGKGSVVTYLHSILNAAGKKVGSTYSPHPTIITERWKIGHNYISKKEFAKIVTYLRPKLDEYLEKTPYDMLSFFEITEIIGLIFFAKHQVKWAVMEVACGGRTDSSNIIPWKDAAIITNIGADHLGILGNNKAEIAYEKAGIIKPKSAVFTMEKNKQLRKIIEQECKLQKIKNYFYVQPKELTSTQYQLTGTNFTYQGINYQTPILGKHQIKNIILCIEIAKFLKIPNTAIQKGLTNIQQPLRMEIVSKNPLVILDGAHNVDKMRTTVETLKTLNYQKLNLLVGFSGDKNIKNMIKQLTSLKPQRVAVTRNTSNPFRKVAELKLVAKTFKALVPKTSIKIFLDPLMALAWLKKQTKKADLLLSTGSIFVSGELRNLYLKQK